MKILTTATTFKLAVAAGVLAILMTGCARKDGSSVTQLDKEGRPAELAAVDHVQTTALPVNVFGEFGGKPTSTYTPAGDVNFQQHTYLDEGYDTDIAVDPTGKWMVYASTRHAEHSNLYLQRTDGHTVTQLTNDLASDAYPAFSPDGKSIAFASTRAGNWQIFAMDIDGRNVVQVTEGPTQAIHPSFSPDGTRLVYCTIGGRSNQWELWVVHLTTGEKQMIGYGLFPEWSPERTVDRIAFQRARQRGGRWFSLWTMDLVHGEARRITEVVASNNAAIVGPTWSPDGKKIAFATIVSPVDASVGQQDVWTINVDGTNRQRLTDGNGTAVGPYWASDNRIYFISNRGGVECVWSTRTDARIPAVAGLVEDDKNSTSASTDAGDVAE